MFATWRSLLRDERGFVITAELVLISTVLVLGLVAALSAVKTAMAGELSDVANAIGSVNQSYYTHGFHGCRSGVPGQSFLDEADSSEEEKADFATGVESCRRVAVATGQTGCANPPCAPPCNPPAPCNPPCVPPSNPPCNGCEPTLPAPAAALPGAPVGTPCGSPCGTSLPCGTPCEATASAPCGTPCSTPVAAPCGDAHYGARYGSSYGGCGSTYQVIEGWSRFGQSVPSVICPPGPGPFTGTDPFAPGAVSPKNMYLEGISYGGVCAPPAALSAPSPGAGTSQPAPELRIMPTPVTPAAYQYEPAFLPPQGPQGTVY